MAVAGFLGGVIAPSRDMLVPRRRTAGAAGRVPSASSPPASTSQRHLRPLLFGWIMDQNLPHWVFGASVVFMTPDGAAGAGHRRASRKAPKGPMPGFRYTADAFPEPHPGRLTASGRQPMMRQQNSASG